MKMTIEYQSLRGIMSFETSWDSYIITLVIVPYLDETLYTHTTLVGTSKQLQKNVHVWNPH